MIWLTHHTLARRLLSISLIFLFAVILLALAPLWLPLFWALGLVLNAAHSSLRCLSFICLFLLCEIAGIMASGWLWLQHIVLTTSQQNYLSANSALQFWWADTLRRSAEKLFRLHFVIEGEDALAGPAAIVLPRHTSIGDTILPVSFYAKAKQLRVSYVLKRELLLDPCLDIVGNRLANVFLNRVAEDMGPELAELETLAASATDQDSLVIYMEGTRFSDAKRQRVLKLLADKGDDEALQRAESWPNLLPIRPAGALALMKGAPDKDLLFLAHSGFEGSANFANLFNGSWMNTTVHLRFWRIKAADIPATEHGRRIMLFSQWDLMQQAVAEMLAAECD
jgi:1-acyl-sn-glycerol-3-phosphate acyltransferase|tara:strand:- start:23769 stop:24782 length:1014 start_codon:yes stop_codon:yes gene_type:complete